MNEKTPSPSIRSLAAKAGVSRTTVSLALRNDRRLTAGTRQRIQALARELGYRPDPTFARLLAHVRARTAVKQTESVAWLTAFPSRDGWRNESYVFREYFKGASERAHQLGYRLDEIWAKEPGMSGRRVSAILRARNIRGLLIAPVPASRGHLSLDWRHFAVAALGYSMWKPEFHRVVANYYQCGMLALREMKRRGYRRIGFAMPDYVDERINHQYLAPFLIYQQTIRASDRIRSLVTRNWEEETFLGWLKKNRPDVVLSTGHLPGRWIRNSGLRVPEEIGFVHIQSESRAKQSAGVYQNPETVGAAAVDLLVGQLHRNEMGIPVRPTILMVSGDWVEGATVRAAK